MSTSGIDLSLSEKLKSLKRELRKVGLKELELIFRKDGPIILLLSHCNSALSFILIDITKSRLDGIPIAIKDNILTKGLQSSAASTILKDFIAPIDSTAVKKLRDAGAIVVGSANMDEMGMGSFGLYGYEGKAVKNPIDENYFAGGSSAGSAVIVKSYQALGALGTDTGGSVNYPAHCCGLFSMKPSFGRISRFGQILYSSSNETTGPF